MTSAEESHRDTMRARIIEKLRSVPPKVNAGSVQMVRDFKSFHSAATRVVETRNASTAKLQDIYNKTLSWYA